MYFTIFLILKNPGKLVPMVFSNFNLQSIFYGINPTNEAFAKILEEQQKLNQEMVKALRREFDLYQKISRKDNFGRIYVPLIG